MTGVQRGPRAQAGMIVAVLVLALLPAGACAAPSWQAPQFVSGAGEPMYTVSVGRRGSDTRLSCSRRVRLRLR